VRVAMAGARALRLKARSDGHDQGKRVRPIRPLASGADVENAKNRVALAIMLSMESTVTFHDESTTAVWYRSSCACATSNQKDPPLSEQPRLIDEIKKLGHRALLFAALSDEKDLAF
jgi:hypothetical protein